MENSYSYYCPCCQQFSWLPIDEELSMCYSCVVKFQEFAETRCCECGRRKSEPDEEALCEDCQQLFHFLNGNDPVSER